MAEKDLVGLDSLPERHFGHGKVTIDRQSSKVSSNQKRELGLVGVDFVYIPSPEDERLISSLEAKIEKIKSDLACRNVVMTPGDKLREEERQKSKGRTEKQIQDIFGSDKSKSEDVSVRKTSRIGRFFREFGRVFTEPKRLQALVGAWIATVGVGQAASVLAKSTDNIDINTTISTEGEILSQKSDLGVDSATSEVSPEPQTTYTLDQVRDSILNGPETTPMPTEKVEVARDAIEAWKQREFGPIETELRAMEGTLEERIPGDARALYCLRNSKMVGNYVLKNHLTEEEIFAHCKGKENKKVIYCEDKEKFIWFVVADKEIEKKAMKGITDALKWYKGNKMPDMLESAIENGLSVFYVANTHTDRGPDSVWLNEWGEICLNQGYENTKKLKTVYWRNQYIRALFEEPNGIVWCQVSKALDLFDNEYEMLGYGEVAKSLMGGYVSEALRGTDKDGRYAIYANELPLLAEHFAKNYSEYGVTVDGIKTKRFLALMADFARIPGFGSLYDVPAYRETLGVAKK